MIKNYLTNYRKVKMALAFFIFSVLMGGSLTAQVTTTEYFDTYVAGATTFTNAASGITFTLTNKFTVSTITSQSLGVNANTPASPTYGQGSPNYVDNISSVATGQVNSIKALSGRQFKTIEIYIYPSSDGGNDPTNDGTVIVKGKLGGTAVVTTTLTSTTFTNTNFAGPYEGFTYVSLPTFSTTTIDELEFTLTGAYNYIALDNFRFTSVPVTPLTASVTSTSVSCFGGTNGSATVTPSGGTPTYSYTWTPSGGNSAIASGLSTGIYTITVKDAASAVYTTTVNIAQPTAVTTSTAVTNIACNGGSTGSATATPSGGVGGPYTYTWSTGSTSNSISGLTAGNYTVKTTDANGCASITKTVTVTQPSALVVNSVSQTNIACNGGSNGAASVSVSGGTTAYSYNWTPGNPTGDGTASVTGLTAGNWTCTVTDANACTSAKTFTVTQPTALSATTAQTNVACNGGSNGVASVSVSGGTTSYSYAWSPSGGTGATASGLISGNYTCTITDANSCTLAKTFTVTQPTSLSATTSSTSVSCFGGSNGTAGVTASGGTAGYTYSWTPSGGTGATASGLTSGNYTCTITDANSCSITKTFTITQPTALSATTSQTNVACNGGTNGVASVSVSGGTTSYSYAWSPSGGTGATASGLASGNYTCTITDANSCSIIKTFTVTQPTALSATTTQTNVACNGGTNGVASVSVSGGTTSYSYAWSPSGGTGATASGLVSGNYTCTITDANSCSIIKTFTVTQPTALSATTTQTNVACNGGTNGVASVSVSGGTTSYSYAWAPSGGAGATASGLVSGNYTCTITDAHSCSIAKTFTVTQPSALSATTTQTNVACFGNATGAASVNVSGGTTSYSYAWSPSGGTGATANGLASANYTCTITDANSCSITKVFTITQPSSGITATTTQTNVACNGGSNAVAVVNASGGTGSISYAWSPSGGSTATASGLSAGNYTCTISDASACSSIKTFTITQPVVLSATTTQTNVACNGGSNAIASVNVSGGTTSYSYAWYPSGGAAATASGLTAGNYTCTITDANSCSIAKAFTVTEPTAITATATVTNPTCAGTCDGTIIVTPSGGTSSYTYSWSPISSTVSTVTGLCQGSYTCTITDANGCILPQTFNVVAPSAIIAIATQTNVSCNGGNNAIASVNVSGGTPNYTYSWSPNGATSATANGLVAGGYTCSITDSHGCIATSTVVINQPAILIASSAAGNISCNAGVTTVTVTETGGTSPYTGDGIFTNITAGTHSYTVTDNNGCMATTTITVTEPTVLMALSSAGTILCNAGVTTVTVTETGGTSPYTGDGIFTNITAGTHSYTVTDNNGCMATTTITITQPNAIATTQSPTLCAGGSIIVGTHTYTTAGTYTDVLTSAAGCDSTVTTNLSINSPIDVSVTNIGATITANNASASSYQWVDCNNGNAPISGQTSQSFTATTNGSYAVIITEGACSNTSTCTIISSTGIAQNNAVNNSLSIYPNPFTNELNITSETKTTAVLFDMLGNKVTEFALQNQTQTLHVGDLAPGIYYLQIDNRKIKIIKQ